jgi:hypothetical protein
LLIHFEDVRAVGFFLFAGGWIVILFANNGLITGSLMIVLDAGILIAGLLSKESGTSDS